VRTIADYLMEERPELLEEMDAFYADRASHLERSIEDVARHAEGARLVPAGRVQPRARTGRTASGCH
jgi:hypothetical protein